MKTKFSKFMAAVGILLLVYIVSSCISTKIPNKTPKAPDLGKSSLSLSKSAKNISDVADSLGNVATDVEKAKVSIEGKDKDKVMIDEVKDLDQAIALLRDYETKLTEESRKLKETEGDLIVATQQVQVLEDTNVALVAENMDLIDKNTKLESDKQAALQAKLTYCIMLGILMIAICGFMFVNGKAGAIGVGVVGIIIVVVSLAISYFTVQFAIIGAVGMVVVLGIGGYVAFRKSKKEKIIKEQEALITKQGTAIKEVTATVEHLKPHIPKGKIKSLFGDLITDGEVGIIQTDPTKELIFEARKEISEKAKPTVPSNTIAA